MDKEIGEMLDHHRIKKLLADYCSACDRCDELRVAEVYCDDSWDDHGWLSGVGRDFARDCVAAMANNNSCSHLLGQSVITLDGDSAGAETCFFAAIRAARADGTEMLHQLGGRYVDRLVREAGGWRIKHRTAVRDWSISLPIDQDWIATQGLKAGRRTGADLRFEALGVTHSGIPGLPDVG